MGRRRRRTEALGTLLELLNEPTQQYDRQTLGAELGVPVRTIARLINDLREEGYRVVSVREGADWHYEVVGVPDAEGGG